MVININKFLLTLILLFTFSLYGCSTLVSGEFTDNDKDISEPATNIFSSNDVEILKN